MPAKKVAPKVAPATPPCDDASFALTVLLWVLVAIAIWYLLNLVFFSSSPVEGFAAAADKKPSKAAPKQPVIEMVYVFSPNCRYCTEFDPVWNKFTAQIKQSGLPSVTTMKSTDSAKYDVQSFPTVLLYRDGKKKATFEGQRTPEKLWDFLRENMK